MILKLKSWILENKIEFITLLSVLFVASFLRLYRIDEFMTFLGDEGRDAIVVRRLLVNLDPILVGPGTSVGNMYLGPAYYYLIAPALLLANFSPVGPSVLVSIFGVATVFLLWYMARFWFGKLPAIIVSFLYAISPTVIVLSRSSWNPNIMPFFSLLTVWSIWKIWKEKKYSWLLVTSISFSFVLQSHYLGLVLFPLIFLIVFLSFVDAIKLGLTKGFSKYLFSSIIISFLFMLPITLFDARYGWRNFEAMKSFFMKSNNLSFSPANLLEEIYAVYSLIIIRLLGAQIQTLTFLPIIFLMVILWFFFFHKEKFNDKKTSSYVLIFFWLILGILGLAFYKNEIYDHYFGFLFTAPFLVLAMLLSKLLKHKSVYLNLSVLFFLTILTVVNILKSPILSSPARQMQRSIAIAQKMADEANGQRFNIAVIADQNYEGAYQYFLEKDNVPFTIIDPQRYDETVADILFVVCEYEDTQKCQPTSNPKAEVANFGWSKVEDLWEIDGLILFKLVHNYPDK